MGFESIINDNGRTIAVGTDGQGQKRRVLVPEGTGAFKAKSLFYEGIARFSIGEARPTEDLAPYRQVFTDDLFSFAEGGEVVGSERRSNGLYASKKIDMGDGVIYERDYLANRTYVYQDGQLKNVFEWNQEMSQYA